MIESGGHMKELHKFLTIFIFVQLVACCGRVLGKYLDYVMYPKIYAMQSAPWYTGIMVTVILTTISVIITVIAYFIVGHFVNKNNQELIEK